MYSGASQWEQNNLAQYYAGMRYGGSSEAQQMPRPRHYPPPAFQNSPSSSRGNLVQPSSPLNNSMPSPRVPPRTQEPAESSFLPYLQDDPPRPPANVSRPPPPPPLPRFIPPQSSRFPSPASPSVDYHSQALAIVGGYPIPRREEPAPYPVMMRPNQSSGPPGNNVPVEAVIARYGQALPDEPLPPLRPPLAGRPMSNPTPHPVHHRLTRPAPNRRTQSDVPLQIQQPVMASKEPDKSSSPKRPVSMIRKLTKKRPASTPVTDLKAKGDQWIGTGPEILPDVLFHVRASQDYEMQSYEELSFSTGAIIAVKSAPENGRWSGYIVNSSGPPQEGIFYRTFVSIMRRVDGSKTNGNILFLVQAVYNYRAMREDEFDFLAGDTIAVYATPSGPFWVGAVQQARAPSRGRMFPWKLVAPIE